MNDVKREAIARIDALSDENECLRDMLNDIAYTLGLDMSEVRYRSEDNYTECQNEVLYEIERRLMPKGMEWPCFENGWNTYLGYLSCLNALTGCCNPPHSMMAVEGWKDTLNRVCKALGLTDGKGLPDQPEFILDEIERRLMPEGMEWPCFEDGELVRLGDKFVTNHGTCNEVAHITFVKSEVCELAPYGFSTVINSHGHEASIYFEGQRVKRPPILDADGAEIHKGDTVYAAPGVGDDGWVIPYTVGRVHDGGVDLICDGESEPSLIHIGGERLTHKQYVLAKDSRPIEVGQTLYGEDGVAWHVCALHPGERYEVESDSMPSLEIRADGTVRHKRLKAEWLTHEKPDTWDRFKHDLFIELSDKSGYSEDVRKEAVAAFVDRAKKLAERMVRNEQQSRIAE